MFDKSIPEDVKIIDKIVAKLNDHDNSKIHERHFNSDFCKDIGLKIEMMEDNDELQDAILSLHHAYMISLDVTSAIKIIENQEQKSFISSVPTKGGVII